jgi:predicted nucleic-acid-binding protein
MIFVDTNFLNRFLLQDIPEQAKIVNTTFEKALKKEIDLYSTDLIFFEVCWSLQQFYELPENDILTKLYDIISSGLINFQSNEVLLKAIEQSQLNSLGIEDNYNLIWSLQQNIKDFKTFDKKLQSSWKKMIN